MGSRRQSRISALGFLYQKDLAVDSTTENPAKFISHFKLLEEDQSYFLSLIEGVLEHQKEIDEELEAAAVNWKLYRMNRLDRCLLRLATWELRWSLEVPLKVIIDEAVEMAKTYGTSDSPGFVNGILDHIARKYRQGPPESTNLVEEVLAG